MWDKLSIKQKNDLMKIYLQNGISSLDYMKEHYNKYATGGNLDNDKDNLFFKAPSPAGTTPETSSTINYNWLAEIEKQQAAEKAMKIAEEKAKQELLRKGIEQSKASVKMDTRSDQQRHNDYVQSVHNELRAEADKHAATFNRSLGANTNWGGIDLANTTGELLLAPLDFASLPTLGLHKLLPRKAQKISNNKAFSLNNTPTNSELLYKLMDDIDKGTSNINIYPNDILDVSEYVFNNTVPRMLGKDLSKASQAELDYVSGLINTNLDIPVRVVKRADFKAALGEDPPINGWFDYDHNHITILDDVNESTPIHELGHAFRYNIDPSEYPTGTEVLQDLFETESFLNNRKLPYDISPNIDIEEYYSDIPAIRYSLLKEAGLEKAPLEQQNKYIDQLDIGTLMEGLESRSGYSSNFLENFIQLYHTLDKKGKDLLEEELLQKFKNSLKTLPSTAVPIGIGTTLSNNTDTQ